MLLLKKSSKLKLWLCICEEWDVDSESDRSNDKNFNISPHFFAARAAAGTLAMVTDDIDIVTTMCSPDSDCSKPIVSMLKSGQAELVIRALTILQKMTGSHGFDEESIQGLLLQRKNKTGNYSVQDNKQIDELLTAWERVCKSRLTAIEHLISCDIMTSFQTVLASAAEPYAVLINEIVQNISSVLASSGLEAT